MFSGIFVYAYGKYPSHVSVDWGGIEGGGMRVGGEAADVDDANGIEEKVLVAALYLFNYFPIIPRPGSCCAVMD